MSDMWIIDNHWKVTDCFLILNLHRKPVLPTSVKR